METINSGHNVAVVNSQNHRRRQGPIVKRHSGSKHAVLHSQINTRSLGPMETINSGHNVAVLNVQNHR